VDEPGHGELALDDALAAGPPFVAGLDLAETLFRDHVEPLLAERLPGLRFGAALIGEGSEVLGFDTPISADHHWGPRVQLFLGAEDLERHGAAIDDLLRHGLPLEVDGFATGFGPPDEKGVRLRLDAATHPVDHMCAVTTLKAFAEERLGFDPTEGLTLRDWLLTPSQRLLELTAGRVFRDDLGELDRLREGLREYPEPVWRYALAAQWERIAEVEAFVGRTGVAGNDTGSRIVAARIVRDLMRLAFLLERRYAPYEKWFGSGFARLDAARHLGPVLSRVLSAYDWTQREGHLADAYRIVARLHNNLGITEPLDTEPSRYHDRPYKVIHGDRFAAAIRATIDHPAVLALPPKLGTIDQVTDRAEILCSPQRCRALAALWV
jgi:Domain of unknown function (DUF4037)